MKKKFQDAEKEAGGDEKLVFKFAWPYRKLISPTLLEYDNSTYYKLLYTLSISEKLIPNSCSVTCAVAMGN